MGEELERLVYCYLNTADSIGGCCAADVARLVATRRRQIFGKKTFENPRINRLLNILHILCYKI
jgi:hypothetical protein